MKRQGDCKPLAVKLLRPAVDPSAHCRPDPARCRCPRASRQSCRGRGAAPGPDGRPAGHAIFAVPSAGRLCRRP